MRTDRYDRRRDDYLPSQSDRHGRFKYLGEYTRPLIKRESTVSEGEAPVRNGYGPAGKEPDYTVPEVKNGITTILPTIGEGLV